MIIIENEDDLQHFLGIMNIIMKNEFHIKTTKTNTKILIGNCYKKSQVQLALDGVMV